MKNIVICNQKGGVCKSMIADELAFSFERSGIPISFYDLDDQGGTLHQSRECDEADVAIIDTPGSLQKEMGDWLEEAPLLIVPTQSTSRDIAPLQRMLEIIGAKAPKTPTIVVINGWNRFRASRDFMDWLIKGLRPLDSTPAATRPSFSKPAPFELRRLSYGVRRMLGFEPEKACNGD